jgi:hypothetical protein
MKPASALLLALVVATPVPRHTELKDFLCQKIRKQLGIEK